MKFTKKQKLVFEMPGKKAGAIIAFLLAMTICISAIVIPIISIPETGGIAYELEVIGIPIILGIVGYMFYRRGISKKPSDT